MREVAICDMVHGFGLLSQLSHLPIFDHPSALLN